MMIDFGDAHLTHQPSVLSQSRIITANLCETQILVTGLVQGVGFRPFVRNIANAHNLSGHVLNLNGNVLIRLYTHFNTQEVLLNSPVRIKPFDPSASDSFDVLFDKPVWLKRFLNSLVTELPSGARVDEIVLSQQRHLLQDDVPDSFTIAYSEVLSPIEKSNIKGLWDSQTSVSGYSDIPKDKAPCKKCIDEVSDKKNRRYQYPFTCCTECGPRYSILTAFPFDRDHTSMVDFPLCDSCQKEYDSNTDRRSYAQTMSCPECGPKLKYIPCRYVKEGVFKEGVDHLSAYQRELDQAANCLIHDGILLIKGTGGYQFLCRVDSVSAVAQLRKLKKRKTKAFSVLVSSVKQANKYVVLSESGIESLTSSASPIVLAPKKEISSNESWINSVAPDSVDLGVMLPTSMLYKLLIDTMHGKQNGTQSALVCTSANKIGEPMITDDNDALQLLDQVDACLLHDRRIAHRLDDSIVRDMGDHTLTVRIGRGLAPLISLLPKLPENIKYTENPIDTHIVGDVLALGSDLKNTFTLLHQGRLYTSAHCGDLSNVGNLDAYHDAISVLSKQIDFRAEHIVGDAHPDFHGRKALLNNVGATSITPLQHHQAHAWSCALENQLGLDVPVLAICLDGYGYGYVKHTDEPDISMHSAYWGAECFYGTRNELTHVATLKPGFDLGDVLSRDPAVSLISYCLSAGIDEQRINQFLATNLSADRLDGVSRFLSAAQYRPQRLSSMGRLLDAIAFACGVMQTQNEYESHAVQKLESLLQGNESFIDDAMPFPFEWQLNQSHVWELNLDSAWHQTLYHAQERVQLAARWLKTLIQAYECLAKILMKSEQADSGLPVLLSGGCFQNRTLSSGLKNALERAGCTVFRHQRVPCNDAGQSIGQAYAAYATFTN